MLILQFHRALALRYIQTDDEHLGCIGECKLIFNNENLLFYIFELSASFISFSQWFEIFTAGKRNTFHRKFLKTLFDSNLNKD